MGIQMRMGMGIELRFLLFVGRSGGSRFGGR